MGTSTDRQSAFRALHAGDMFVMPNPWDLATARMLAGMDFKALATSSAALAWTLGAADATGAVTREIAIAHAVAIGEATGLPVNGDFESGYGSTPGEVAETVRQAIDAGVAGCSIEDVDQASGRLYGRDDACRRLEAAVNVVAASATDFVLTGRCEVFFFDHPDRSGEAVERLKAYEALGVRAVYAPGLTRPEDVGAIVDAVSVPVNVLYGLGGVSNDLSALGRLGVSRVSIGSGLAKVSIGAFRDAASALAEGRFAFEPMISSADIHAALKASGR